ncbi:DEAD/DEAH box helicase [bacterium]|nr:DEAD/DEAH box helicase [bacterium]
MNTPDTHKVIEPKDALPETTLEHLPAHMRDAVARMGWPALMPVQAKAIPYMLAGRDLMVQSRTGSGKTGAFVLPILDRIDQARAVTQALALVPTRELAVQVAAEAHTLAGDAGVRVATLYGGVSYGPQLDALKRGAHFVVGTPGRILDHLLKRNLTLDGLRILVFDEADRMLSMGFYPDMKRLQRYVPREYNAYMFSATFPPHVMRLAHEFMHHPDMLSLSRDHVHVTDTEHAYYIVPAMQRDRALIRVIEMENPESAIIFCNRKADVDYVTIVLQRFGYDADRLSADLSQAAREKVLSKLRAGTLRFLVATDIAGRGIDIPDLSHVIQYDPPEDPEAYVHRAGRTGRAGATGTALTLVTDMEEDSLKGIGRRFHIEFLKRPLPSDEDIQNIVSQRLTVLLEAKLRAFDRVQVERMQRFMPLAQSLADNEDELAVMGMLLDEYYQQTLHGKPVPPQMEESAQQYSERPPREGGGGRRRGGGGRGGRRR